MQFLLAANCGTAACLLDLEFQYESVTFLDCWKAVTYIFQAFHFPATPLGLDWPFLAPTSSSIVILLEMHFQSSCMSELSWLALTFHGGEFGWIYKLLVSKSFSYRTLMTFSPLSLRIQGCWWGIIPVWFILLLVTTFFPLFGIS